VVSHGFLYFFTVYLFLFLCNDNNHNDNCYNCNYAYNETDDNAGCGNVGLFIAGGLGRVVFRGCGSGRFVSRFGRIVCRFGRIVCGSGSLGLGNIGSFFGNIGRIKSESVEGDFCACNREYGELVYFNQAFFVGAQKLCQFIVRNSALVGAGKQVVGACLNRRALKQLVESGDIQKARKLMGHGYSVSGTVVYGKQVGRTIGIPTANLALETEQIYPPRGVYATRTTVMDKTYISMTNIGTRPTVSDKDTVNAETYIFDFNENIYGKEIKVEFFEKIRDEKKFKDIEELRQQLEKDKESTAKYFKSV